MFADVQTLSIGAVAALTAAGAVAFYASGNDPVATPTATTKSSQRAANPASISPASISRGSARRVAEAPLRQTRAESAGSTPQRNQKPKAEPSRFATPRAELAFMQQRRVGESRQVQSREQSLDLLLQAQQDLSLSDDDRQALEARQVKLYQRIEQHRNRLADTDQRIVALQTSVDAAKKELP